MYQNDRPEIIIVAETLLTRARYSTIATRDASTKDWVVVGRKGNRTIQVSETPEGNFWYDERVGVELVYDQEITDSKALHGLI